MVNSLVELSGLVVRTILFTGTRPGSLNLAHWGGDETLPAEAAPARLPTASKEIERVPRPGANSV